MKCLFLIIILILIMTVNVYAKDRCHDYLPDMRQASIMYLGLDYPWWYNVGSAIAETNCRGDLISFDGGIGLFQFTPSTGVTKELEKYIKVDPYNVKTNIRMQAFYIHLIKDKKFKMKRTTIGKSKNPVYPKAFVNYCGLFLSDVYLFYNGGFWSVYEASRKPNVKFVCGLSERQNYCVRSGVWVGKGKKRRWLSFCDVNYKYSTNVYKYAKPYRAGADKMEFWWSERGLSQ